MEMDEEEEKKEFDPNESFGAKKAKVLNERDTSSVSMSHVLPEAEAARMQAREYKLSYHDVVGRPHHQHFVRVDYLQQLKLQCSKAHYLEYKAMEIFDEQCLPVIPSAANKVPNPHFQNSISPQL